MARNARAMLMRCFCPPREAHAALADLRVVAVRAASLMNSCALAAFAAAITCSIVASAWP